ncbi:hypothetical protein GAYE_SCF07G2876 [Galdieria yellowstonensis]|uniref:Glucosidase 2 subunit beta n=1 Tax=Galdieria yellowstonensis TaxID=3028027 RepID=A0AAV9IC97_9RHOD|nr:hypothetical protein GAYE_SCF07G2876 [Galdieria yellowstonensis]
MYVKCGAWLVLLLFLLCRQGTCSTVRGVNPKQLGLYENRDGFFYCLNSTQRIPYSSLNDDFCDCDDGTDEPGTSACDRSVFYCENVGYLPAYIPSSQVNDGICDCCDGSDEWLKYVDCPNRCVQIGRERIEVMLNDVKSIKQGLMKREELKRLSFLKASELKNKTALLKSSIREAEILEKKLKKKLEWFEQVLKVTQSQGYAENVSTSARHSCENARVGKVTSDEESDVGTEIKEESLHIEENEADYRKFLNETEIELSQPDRVVEACQNISQFYTSSRLILRLEKYFYDFLSKFPMLSKFFIRKQKQRNTEILEICTRNLREQLENLRSELERNRTELERIQQYFSIDYGPDSVFLALRDICLEIHSQGYHYKLCLLSHVSQDGIDLGHFKQWDSNYTKMIYTDGTPCWNGPSRSTIVNLICGVNETILSVSEPAKCQYHFWVTTCAVCSIDELKKLRDEASHILSNFNVTKEQKSTVDYRHDEL